MAKAEDKQDTIREFKPLSRLIGETRNNLAKVATKCSLCHFRPILNIQCMEIRPPPLSIMLLTGPTYPVANRLEKNEFLVELDLWTKHI